MVWSLHARTSAVLRLDRWNSRFIAVHSVLILLTLSAAPGLIAHDLWLERNPGIYMLRYGHIRPSDQDQISLALSLTGLRGIVCQTVSGRQPLKFSLLHEKLSAPGNCDAVAVAYEGGYFSKTVNGTVRLPRNQSSNVLKSWLSFEYIKRIDAWNASTSQPLGQRLEITPQSNIETASVGQKITFLVTSNGIPLSGVVVAVHDDPKGVTDSHGLVNIRIREKGTQLFTVTQVVPLKRADADEEIHTARIQFEVK